MSDAPAPCAEIEALAPELAVGVVSGPERASALAHLAQCPLCRRLVDDLATTADPLLLLAPDMEPSIGFESRILAATMGLDRDRPPVPSIALASRPRPGRGRFRSFGPRIAAAATIVVVAATGGLLAGRALDSDRPPDMLRIAQAVSANGRATCRAFAYGDKQAWVFVSFEAPREWTADYTVEITTLGGGTPAATGKLRLQDGGGSLGTVIDVPASQLRAVRVFDASGALRYEAPFHRS